MICHLAIGLAIMVCQFILIGSVSRKLNLVTDLLASRGLSRSIERNVNFIHLIQRTIYSSTSSVLSSLFGSLFIPDIAEKL